MSSAAVDAGPAPERRRSVTIAIPLAGPSALIAGGTSFVLVLAAFVATGGLRVEPTTRILILLMLGGGALSAAAAVRAPRSEARPLYGAWPLLLFAALAAYTAISIHWSLAPADSWMEANRTLAYVTAFAGAIAMARLAPRAWPGMLAGLAIGCLAICGWALLTKIFPGALAPDETYARLRAPFDYWNSVALMGALGVPPFLWLAARRTGNPFVNALAWPALALLVIAIMASYSRGALLALGIGLAFWLAFVPLRLPSLAVLGGVALCAGPLVAWSFAQDGLTVDEAPLAARVDAGHEFGTLLVLVAVVLFAVGLAFEFRRSQRFPTPGRRLSGRVALAAIVVLALGLTAAAIEAPGDFGDRASDAWTRLTDPNAPTPANTPGRLTATSSVRARYFDEAFKVHALSPWIGTGAGAFATARTRFRRDALAVRHAHGYVPQTLADLGWVGMGISLLALLAWGVSAARATGMRRRDRGLPFDSQRVGLLALFAVVLIFGVHSSIDWTWFVPANALAAILAAGWLAGSVPLRARLLGRPPAAPVAAPGSRRARVLAWARSSPAAALAAVLIVVIALAASWTAYQPVRSLHAGDAAYNELDRKAFEQASATAKHEVDLNPLSVDARFDQAAVEQARGQLGDAEAALVSAVRLEPANPETWRRLGRFRLDALQKPEQALKPFQAAYFLDPHSAISQSDMLEVTRALGG